MSEDTHERECLAIAELDARLGEGNRPDQGETFKEALE